MAIRRCSRRATRCSAAASQSPLLVGVRPEEQEDAPQLKVDIDRIKARALGLSIADVNATLAINFGSAYANDFAREGRVLRVLMVGRRALSHDAAGHPRPQGAQRDRRDGAVRRLRHGRMERRRRRSCSAITAIRR